MVSVDRRQHLGREVHVEKLVLYGEHFLLKNLCSGNAAVQETDQGQNLHRRLNNWKSTVLSFNVGRWKILSFCTRKYRNFTSRPDWPCHREELMASSDMITWRPDFRAYNRWGTGPRGGHEFLARSSSPWDSGRSVCLGLWRRPTSSAFFSSDLKNLPEIHLEKFALHLIHVFKSK